MVIPDSIKENVRAVLLSKTDGSGILVSTFLKDYKNIIHQPLMYRDMGYENLELFIKDLPDVCRLEYSEKQMAFKLFGIAKPNTFVSSFVRRAEGGSEEQDSDYDRKGRNRKPQKDNIRPTSDLNEKWLPNPRGLFTLCFPNRKGNGLESKELVAMRFAQLGEVVEISQIQSHTFVRYREEKVAKKAVELFGDQIGLRRADERVVKSGGRSNESKPSARGDNGSGSDREQRTNRRGNCQSQSVPNNSMNSRRGSDKREVTRSLASDLDDECWDEDGDSSPQQRINSIPNGLSNHKHGQSRSSSDNSVKNYQGAPSRNCDIVRNGDDRPKSVCDSQMTAGSGHYPRDEGFTKRSDSQSHFTQVYIGNWPSEATEGHKKAGDLLSVRDIGVKSTIIEFKGLEKSARGPVMDVLAILSRTIDTKTKKNLTNDLRELVSPYDCMGCRIMNAKDSKVKKFAFVDFRNERDARKLINDLDKTMYKNRDLQCRLGKKNPAATKSHSPKPKGSIEQEFERLNVHRGLPRTNHSTSNKSPQSKSSNSPQISTLTSPPMPALEIDMPPLETKGRSPKQMPPLENSSPMQMPPLENFDEMPPLEQVMSPAIPTINGKVYQDMPTLEPMSPARYRSSAAGSYPDMPKLEPMSPSFSEQGVQLNIGNFPYGTTEEELFMMFRKYGAQRITVMNNNITARSTYAFADFAEVGYALNAMENLDQSPFKGRKLVVTLSNPGAVLQQQQNHSQQQNMQQMSPIPNLTCTVTAKEGRSVQVKGKPKLSDGTDSECSYDSFHQPMGGQFNHQRFTTTLQEFTKLGSKLRADEMFEMEVGMRLRVVITHVENTRFFWAQIRQDSVNGGNRSLIHFQSLSREMQLEPKLESINGLGRCMAKFENEWYRAWCTFLTEKNGIPMGDVIFIDYGNRAFTPKSEMMKSKTPLWSLPPMARPFKLAESKVDLSNYINKDVTLDVLEPGCHRTNSLTTVRAQWM